jgi:hypothetical protein
MMARHLDLVHRMMGILRHFQAFSSLQVFSAPKQNPDSPQRQ